MFSFCMYCCKERCAAITLSVFSVLFAISSAVLVFLLTRLKSDSFIWELQTDPTEADGSGSTITDVPPVDIETVKQIVFWGIISLCALAVLTGILGLVNGWYKTCCTIGVYAFLTLVLTLAFLLIGGLLMTVTVAASKQLDQYCQSNSTSSNQTGSYENRYDSFTINFSRYFLGYVDDYQYATGTFVSDYLCSNKCPCVNIENQTQLYPGGFKSKRPLIFNGKYASAKQCYDDLVTDQKISFRFSQTLLDFISYLESDHECTSVCLENQADFAFFQDIRTKPTFVGTTCATAIRDRYIDYLGVLSLILLITCLLVFLAFNAQYGLWRRRFTSNKNNEGGPQKEDRAKNYLVEDNRA